MLLRATKTLGSVLQLRRLSILYSPMNSKRSGCSYDYVMCSGAHCIEPAPTLSCPVCLKEGRSIFFCGQDCFKKNWGIHKLLHNSSGSSMIYEPGWEVSGTVKPFPVTPRFTDMPLHIKLPDYALTGVPKSEEALKSNNTIKVLNREQIEKMRTVCKLARQVLDIAGAAIKPGITTDQLDKIVLVEAIKRNAYPSPLNYRGFPKSCCTSVNEVICHGIPDLRPLKEGDIVNIDVTLYYDGFHGDLNETFVVGQVDEDSKQLIQITKESMMEAIKITRPGVPYKEIGNVIQRYVSKYGYSVVRSYCGHGVNEVFHGPPCVPHYANNKTHGIMQAGHTFTIEPMICMGKSKDIHWGDGWTCLTKDGQRSAQFENTILVTENGYEILTVL
jgi:methionyl aminopeptidase